MDVATDAKALRLRVRKVSRSHVFDSPSLGEDRKSEQPSQTKKSGSSRRKRNRLSSPDCDTEYR
jgi:hypothetical protein